MADAKMDPSLNCTANDFGVSSITVTNLDDPCTDFGDSFTFDGLFGVGASTTNRYDIGFYVGGDGEQAYTGSCFVTTIPPNDPNFANLDGDQCGDYDGDAFILQVQNVTSKCVDEDRNGFFDVAICTSWDNNTVPDCDGPEDAIPSTKSKCSCQQINTNLEAPHCQSNADCATDNNVCTTEVCNPRGSQVGDEFGCSHNPNTVSCNDGQFCTTNDQCSNGSCGGSPRVCSDGNVCTTDACNETTDACTFANNTAGCSDGLFCTTGDVCSGGQCNGSPRSCNDANVCTDDSCNETTDACVNAANTAPCTDSLFCNGTDTCSGGTCGHSGNPCAGADGDGDCTETCNETADNCEGNDPNGTTCNDGLFCTTGDVCTGGVCDGADTDCDDANFCTNDSCNEAADTCTNAPNSNPCDDELFCTTNDTCAGGTCTGAPTNCSDNNDCTTDSCNDGTDSCDHSDNTLPCDDGLFCTENDTCGGGLCEGTEKTCNDSNVCTDDSCDETGNACVNGPNTDPCEDGIFCNGDDVCAGGSCGHSGNPCDGVDNDADCSEICDEAADNCEGDDPNGSNCNDGLFCNGVQDKCVDGECSDHPGDPCDDSEACTDDVCDEEDDLCEITPVSNGTPCDDEDICTIDDGCSAGSCVGQETVLQDLCPWIAVERQDPKRDTLKIRNKAGVGGDTCGGATKIGNAAVIDGDVVSNLTGGTRAIRISPDDYIDDDIVTAGAGVKALPRVAKLPHLATLVSSLPPGAMETKLLPPGGQYNLTGAHQLADDCNDARNVYPQVMAVLDALPSGQSLPKQKIRPFQTLTLTAGSPGAVNTIDVEQIRTGRNIILELNGAGNPNTVLVVRIAKKLQMKLGSVVTLTGGLLPENVLIYVKGRKCVFGDLMEGSGTVLCGNGKLKTGRFVVWSGTFYGAGRLLKIGDNNTLTYLPFQGF
jgi:hypothetical protein